MSDRLASFRAVRRRADDAEFMAKAREKIAAMVEAPQPGMTADEFLKQTDR